MSSVHEASPGKKLCTQCLKEKAFECFKKRSNGVYGLESQCRECENTKDRNRLHGIKNLRKKTIRLKIPKTKICPKCGGVGPFGKDTHRWDGLAGLCKKCKLEATKKWQTENPEKKREVYTRWASANPEKVKEKDRKWAKEHPENIRQKTRNRRVLKRKSKNKITLKEWRSVLEKYGNKCLYPGCDRTDVTMDHVIPLALGGTHTVDNVQPLCLSHNSSKGARNTNDYR